MSDRGAGVEAANAEALARITAARPFLVDVMPAGEVIPDLEEGDLLHAGPPLEGWSEVAGALRGSVLGALVHLGLARDLAEAEERAAGGGIRLEPANDHHAGGTYAGVIARSTPVLVVEDRERGGRALTAINEGRGKALRYGANVSVRGAAVLRSAIGETEVDLGRADGANLRRA